MKKQSEFDPQRFWLPIVFVVFTAAFVVMSLAADRIELPSKAIFDSGNRAGSLDPTFGPNGIVTTALEANDPEYASSIAVQDDGRILLVGRKPPYSGSRDAFIIRHNSDGSLDPSFGSSGIVILPLPQSNSFEDVVIQSDGKIVAVGTIAQGVSATSGGDFFIARFNRDGSLDTTFNSTGMVFTDFNSTSDEAFAVALQPDGRIMVGGYSTPGGNWKDYAFARYLTDGSLDPNFGTGGKFQQSGNTFTGDDIVYDILVQEDGKIVGVGDTSGSGSSSYVAGLVRINSNGSLDQTFGTGGFVKTNFGGPSHLRAGELMPDGRIVVAGVRSSFSDNFAVARYLPDGQPDVSFSGDGQLTTAVSSQASGADLELHEDGRILVVGFSNSSFLLVRYGYDGTLDSSFGDGGIVLQSAGGFDDDAFAVSLLSNGKILAAGRSGRPISDRDIALLRFNSNGSLDTSFGPLGRVITSFSNYNDTAHDIRSTADNKTVVAGTVAVGSSTSRNFTVARYLSTGALDATFNGTGFVTILVGFSADAMARVAVQRDGKVVLAGYGIVSGQPQTQLVRFNPNGTNDPTFGTNGRVILGGNSIASGHALQDLALMPDGRIVLGYTATDGGRERCVVIRINKNGAPDEAFGTGGRTLVSALPTGDERLRSIALEPSGRLIVAGEVQNAGTPTAMVARINWEGTPDMSFGKNGYVIPDVGSIRNDRIVVAVSPLGRIVTSASRPGSFVVVQLHSNGSPDLAFGSSGISSIPLGGLADPAPRDMVVQSNGRILIAGSSVEASDSDFAVIRVGTDGELDQTFGKGGVFSPEMGELEEEFYGIDLRDNGTILFAGTQKEVTRKSFAIYSLLGDRTTHFDFDGDGKADQAVFRPAEGVWYLLQSRDSALGYGFGLAGDQLTAADYDGDRKTDPGIYREGVWWVLNSNGSGHNAIQWGIASDIPVAADYDGDGKADRSVYRDGTWWILFSNGAGYTTINWGIAGDKPVPADYDGDGKADFAVYRNGEWWILFANGSGYNMVQSGTAADKPVPADYDGDGIADIAFYREGEWSILNSMGQTSVTRWGIPGDEPVPADYDGDGRTDISIYRNGEWWTLYSNGYTNNTWGIPGDVPVPRR